MPKRNTRVRDSRTGLFVPRQQAVLRPNTTQTEVIRKSTKRG